MMDATSSSTVDARPQPFAYIPTGVATLDAIWGSGLPMKGICELRADDAVDFMAITRQLINAFLERGENVLYFSIVENPHPSPIPETGIRARSDDGHPRGQLDVHCRSTFGLVERKLSALEAAGKHYSAIFVDVLSPNPSGCPTAYSAEEGRPPSAHSKAARRAFLRYGREVVESLGSTLLLLEHNMEDLTGALQGRDWGLSVDGNSPVDARTIILLSAEAPGDLPYDGLIPAPLAEAWTSMKYLDEAINPAPLYPNEDGAIDDEMSLAALLVLQGVIKRNAQGFVLPDEEGTEADLEAVRNWVVANISRAKHLVLNIAK